MAMYFDWKDLHLDTYIKHERSGAVLKLVDFDGCYRIFQIVDKGSWTCDGKFCVANANIPPHESLAGFTILCNFQKGQRIMGRDLESESWKIDEFSEYNPTSFYPFCTEHSLFRYAVPVTEMITIDNREFSLEKVRKAVADLTPVA